MSLIEKLYYNTWNIGFIERSISDVILSPDTELNVNWVRHDYHDRFFADPFVLSADDKEIKVLVEDYPYYDKKGMISLLIIDRKSYELREKKVVLEENYHMSYPFIIRGINDSVWVAPEASISGAWYRYLLNSDTDMLEEKSQIKDRPLLDSTIVKFGDYFWLFCTEKGSNSNSDLYIYYADKPEGPWLAHNNNPTVSDLRLARPAGGMIVVDGILYRVTQKCDMSYGESIYVAKVETLNENDFKQTFVKELRARGNDYSCGFHTINGYDNICVVDGLRKDFAPFRRFFYEMRNLL